MVYQECIVEYGSLPGEHLDMIMIFQIMISMVMNFQGNSSKVTRAGTGYYPSRISAFKLSKAVSIQHLLLHTLQVCLGIYIMKLVRCNLDILIILIST